MTHLADTNVVSELIKPTGNQLVNDWLDANQHDIYISAATIAEIARGIELLDPGKRRDTLIRWLSEDLPRAYSYRILPIDERVAERWGTLMVRSQRRGNLLSVMDGFIAATAHEHSLTLVTRNIRHFIGLDIQIVNPWEPTRE